MTDELEQDIGNQDLGQSLTDEGTGICSVCGLPKPDLCTCVDTEREGTTLNLRTEKRKFGKDVTIIEGVSNDDIDNVAKELKTFCACGGTVKAGSIELQGSHIKKAGDKLQTMGFQL